MAHVSRAQATLVVLVGTLTTLGNAQANCGPDDSCNSYRECYFATLEMYDHVRNRIFYYAGCPPSCINQCTCTCNTSGPVFNAFQADPVLYCADNSICTDPAVVKALSYPAAAIECETALNIALASVYQLCATVGGICQNGTCTQSSCVTRTDPPCRQLNGFGIVGWVTVGLLFCVYVSLYLGAMIQVRMHSYEPLVADITFEPRVGGNTGSIRRLGEGQSTAVRMHVTEAAQRL